MNKIQPAKPGAGVFHRVLSIAFQNKRTASPGVMGKVMCGHECLAIMQGCYIEDVDVSFITGESLDSLRFAITNSLPVSAKIARLVKLAEKIKAGRVDIFA